MVKKLERTNRSVNPDDCAMGAAIHGVLSGDVKMFTLDVTPLSELKR